MKYVKVARGRKGPIWHCFLVVGTKYVDMTIAQFDSKLPDLFVIDKLESEKYYLSVDELYTINEWFDWEENN